jgi:hypothetical protein
MTAPGEHDRPAIPVLEVEGDWVIAALERSLPRLHALLDLATRRVPGSALRLADAASRRWLEQHRAPRLAEIDRVAAIVGRPGAYFFNVSYEWGCTSRAAPAADGAGAELLRVLDWPDPGLGRHVMALVIHSPAGPWLTLTWPGYVGALQGMAPGRFSAALNQAPLEGPTGIRALDWAATRRAVWRRPHPPAAHLLRRVFETAPDYATARRLLSETPIAAGAIFALAGTVAEESCVIERRPEASHLRDGPAAAANAWTAPGWRGRARGMENTERREMMAALAPRPETDAAGSFDWLRPPLLNDRTRLVFRANAASGAYAARGYERDGPATAPLHGRLQAGPPTAGGASRSGPPRGTPGKG